MKTTFKTIKLLALGVIIFSATSCSTQTNEKIETSYESYSWDVSSLENEGLDKAKVDAVIQKASQFGYIRSIGIIKNNKLVVEEYFNGYSAKNAFALASATKGFVSAATGIAVKQELIATDNKAVEYFPEYKSQLNDERKGEITIEQLLQMRAGFRFHPGIYKKAKDMNGVLFTGVSLGSAPGTKWDYNGSSTHIVSSTISKKAGKSISDYVNAEICEPLGITIARWDKLPNGEYFGGSGIHMTKRDALRFGQLYLNMGNINGKQIIDTAWIEKSVTSYSNFKDILSPEMEYGYLWWIENINGRLTYHSSGHGGQFIVNIPDTDMCIVVFADTNVKGNKVVENMQTIYGLIKEIIKSTK